MAPSEVTLKFGAESQVFELEPGGELNALAIKDCFGLQTVKLDGKVVSVNQSNGLTYRTFQHGETISVEGTAALAAPPIPVGHLMLDVLGTHHQWIDVGQLQRRTTSSSSRNAANAVFNLTDWEYPSSQVLERLQDLNGCRFPPAVDPRPAEFAPTTSYQNEAETNSEFEARVLDVCQAVLRGTSPRAINLRRQLGCPDGTVPDWTWLDTTDYPQRTMPSSVEERNRQMQDSCLLVGEGKVHSLLTEFQLDGTIVQAFQANHSGARTLIKQTYNYMSATRCKYGFMTDYFQTWACKLDVESNTLNITKAYLCKTKPTDQDPQGQAPHGQEISVAQLIMSLILTSRSEKELLAANRASSAIQQSQPVIGSALNGAGASQASGSAAGSSATGASGSVASGSAAGGSAPYRVLSSTCLTHMECLGEGMSGTAMKASLDGRLVALKAADVYNSRDIVRMLKHEAAVYEALSLLQGVAIPELVGCGYQLNGTFFLATSLVLGSHPLTGQRVAHSVRAGATSALGMIHAAGYLHNDVRRLNIIVEKSSGQVFFIDLGLSCSKELFMGEFEAACEAEMEALQNMLARRSTDSEESQQVMWQCLGSLGAGEDSEA